MKPKYKLVRELFRNNPETKMELYRIKAVRGVPERGIKRGTKGGLVSGEYVLSQTGTCWIEASAMVIAGTVSEDALVAEEAVVIAAHISGNAVVSGNSKVGSYVVVQDFGHVSGNAEVTGTEEEPTSIIGNGGVAEQAIVSCSQIGGTSLIGGHATVSKSFIAGESSIDVGAKVSYSTLTSTKVSDSANVTGSKLFSSTVDKFARVDDSTLLNSQVTDDGKVLSSDIEDTQVENRAVVQNSSLGSSQISGFEIIDQKTSSGVTVGKQKWEEFLLESQRKIRSSSGKSSQRQIRQTWEESVMLGSKPQSIHVKTLESIESKYEEYTTDIINILTYPVMTDLTDDATRNLVKCLHKARRYVDAADEENLAKAVDDLEDAFLLAEANARKVKDTGLNASHQKKLKDAQQMFTLAFDPGASEHEKTASFKAGMGNLKGVIAVPDKAVAALKERIGLKELTA